MLIADIRKRVRSALGKFALFFNGRFLKLYGIGICSCQPALPPGEGYHDVD